MPKVQMQGMLCGRPTCCCNSAVPVATADVAGADLPFNETRHNYTERVVNSARRIVLPLMKKNRMLSARLAWSQLAVHVVQLINWAFQEVKPELLPLYVSLAWDLTPLLSSSCSSHTLQGEPERDCGLQRLVCVASQWGSAPHIGQCGLETIDKRQPGHCSTRDGISTGWFAGVVWRHDGLNSSCNWLCGCLWLFVSCRVLPGGAGALAVP
jgi:hypothetical protein